MVIDGGILARMLVRLLVGLLDRMLVGLLDELSGRRAKVLGLLRVEGLGGGWGDNTWWETDAGRAENLNDKCQLTLQVGHFTRQCRDLALWLRG